MVLSLLGAEIPLQDYRLTLDTLGIPLVIIYVLADVGSVGGGWFFVCLHQEGVECQQGPEAAMLICALAVLPIMFASQASELWMAVALLGLATAAHQGWSANIFTTASDMFPRKAVGSIVGFGGMAGSIGGMLFSTSAGLLLEWTGSYMTLFVVAGLAYVVALGVFQILVPKLEPAKF